MPLKRGNIATKPVTAYILLTVETGMEYDVIDLISKVPGIREATITYGMWDMVVKVEVSSLPELDKLVTKVRQIKGVEQTTTLIGV